MASNNTHTHQKISRDDTNTNVLKTVFLGDTGVGKTSFITRYTTGQYRTHTDSTIGCSFYRRYLDYHGVPYKIDIWDTAGQERFRSMMPMYYRNANIVYICLDLSRDDFRDRFLYWKEQLDYHKSDDVFQKIIIVGTKADAIETELDTIKLLYHSFFAEYPMVSYFFVSAKEENTPGCTSTQSCFEQSYRLYFRDLDLSYKDSIQLLNRDNTTKEDDDTLSLDGSDIKDATEIRVSDKYGNKVEANPKSSASWMYFYCSIL